MSHDNAWADVIEHRELLLKRRTIHCVTCGIKLKKTRPDYFTEWCSTECRLDDKRKIIND
jgi:hypothetical protein